ncbi:MAG: CDP-alcohol phosphatidyltransferase family protein [Rectinema sp.]
MVDEKRTADLRHSILLTISIFFIVQCALFLLFAVSAGFASKYWSLFLPISGGFHIFVLILLLLFQDDFIIESSGEKLDHINLANIITLSRVSTMPTLLVLVMAAKEYGIRIPLLVLVAVIFLTDFLDGRISRKNNQVTRVGKMMDSASDYTLLVVLSVIFRYYSLIPEWFFVLVLVRLGIQVLFMAILVVVKKRIEPNSTFMGKLNIASIMVLYTLELIQLAVKAPPLLVFRISEWIVAIILVLGIFDKIAGFFDALKSGPPAP